MNYEQENYFQVGENLSAFTLMASPATISSAYQLANLGFKATSVAAKAGAKRLDMAAMSIREFSSTHTFRTPITFHYDDIGANVFRLNAGISIDAVKLQKPWINAKNDFGCSNKLSRNLFTPKFNQIESFTTTKALGGVLYPNNKLTMLVKYLEKRGVYVYGTIGDPYFIGRKKGAPQLYLPENPTILQVKHELSHWLDFKRLGYEEYSNLSVYQREKMVLERLKGNRIWIDLNQLEKDFSLNCVEKIRLGYKPGGQL